MKIILTRLVTSLNKNRNLKWLKYIPNVCRCTCMGTLSTHERILCIAALIFLDSFVQTDLIHQSKQMIREIANKIYNLVKIILSPVFYAKSIFLFEKTELQLLH